MRNLLDVKLTVLAMLLASMLVSPLQAANWSEVGRGPNSTTWARSHQAQVEVASGLNYQAARTGQWQPAAPAFSLTADGSSFTAQQVQHRAWMSSEINVKSAISIRMGDGLELDSTPLAIGLLEPANNNFMVLAGLTNAVGAPLATNQVVYPNAFSGHVCASVVYTISQSTFEQDVVLTSSLDFDPYQAGFSTNCWLQIITEVYNGPVPDRLVNPVYIESDPAVRAASANPDRVDQTLGFSGFVMGPGYAFTAPTAQHTNGLAVPMFKQFVQDQQGRMFLIENVLYASIAAELQNLPSCAPSGPPGHGHHASITHPGGRDSLYAAFPAAPERVAAMSVPPGGLPATPVMLAANQPPLASRPAGVWMDYLANIGGSLNSATVFQSSTNYYISGTVYCNGATTFEPAVFKYATNAAIQVGGSLALRNFGPYRGAVFTAVDDDTIGDSLRGVAPSYTGVLNTNGYANPAIGVNVGSLSLTNCRFAYAKLAVQSNPGVSGVSSLTLTHSQIINCVRGLLLGYDGKACGGGCGCGVCPSFSYGTTLSVSLNNTLISGVPTVVQEHNLGMSTTISLQNCTVDRATTLVLADQSCGSVTLNAFNSILANVTSTSSVTCGGNNNGFYSAPAFGLNQHSVSGASPFQTAGGGKYYLAAGSSLRGVGSNNFAPAALLADLQKRTTYPPQIIGGWGITSAQTLSPQVGRNSGGLDLGYHYDPIDYALNGVLVTDAPLTINPGTVIAGFGTNGTTYGLAIGVGASLQSIGTPSQPIWFVHYNTVHEQPGAGWTSATNGLLLGEFQGLTPAPSIACQFTHWSVAGLDLPGFSAPTNTGPYYFQDCEFHGGKVLSVSPSLVFTNCLFERTLADVEPQDGNQSCLHNCLVYGGIMTLGPGSGSSLIAFDNLFDQPTLTNWNGFSGGWNAYVTNHARLQATNSSDFTLAGSPAYQAGPLGNYYQLTNSPLINAGSTYASNVMLFQYTVTTNLVGGLQVKEAGTVVDCGYHYVATDALGNPLSTLAAGTPDYVEDDGGQLSAWETQFFGTTGINLNTQDFSGSGMTFGQDYTNSITPVVFAFTGLELTNNFVARTIPLVQLDVAGSPGYFACVVDSTNLAGATWYPYSASNLWVTVGSTPGTHEVWVGISGPVPGSSTPVWQNAEVRLATNGPVLVITQPVGGVTARPVITISGYSPGPLNSLTYDVANSAGTVTNLPGFVTSQAIDPVSRLFTTNSFSCYDVSLANGTNQVTFHATDPAGNSSTTVWSVALNLASNTNPPVFSLYYPQSGASVAGTQFTLNGQVDNPTASVTAQIRDSFGNSSNVAALVEANGVVWAENLPLSTGSNWVTITLQDASGNQSSSNLVVVGAGASALTVDPVDPSDLTNSNCTVTGTVASGNTQVWVNGVAAGGMVLNADGTWDWTASYVPLNSGGTAIIQARALPTSINGGYGTSQDVPEDNAIAGNPQSIGSVTLQYVPEKPASLFVEEWHTTNAVTTTDSLYQGSWYSVTLLGAQDLTNTLVLQSAPQTAYGVRYGFTYNWQYNLQPSGDALSDIASNFGFKEQDFMASNGHGTGIRVWGASGPVGNGTNIVGSNIYSWRQRVWQDDTFEVTPPPALVPGATTVTYSSDYRERVKMLLRTGGKHTFGAYHNFLITASATNSVNKLQPVVQPAYCIVVLGRNLSSAPPYVQGTLYLALPDNTDLDLTPLVDSPRYDFSITAQRED